MEFYNINNIDCVQDFEKNEEYINWLAQQHNLTHLKGIKVFLLSTEDFQKPKKDFLTFHIVDNKLWFDFEDQYLVCEELNQDTISYFKQGNKEFILGVLNQEAGTFELLDKCTLHNLSKIF